MTTAHELADRLEAIRKRRGIAVSALPEMTGIADKTLRRRLRNPAQFTISELDALSDAFSITLENLLNLDIAVEDLDEVAA